MKVVEEAMHDPTNQDAIINAVFKEITAYDLPSESLARLTAAVTGLERFVSGDDDDLDATPRAFRWGLSRSQWARLEPAVRRALVLKTLAAQEAGIIPRPAPREEEVTA